MCVSSRLDWRPVSTTQRGRGAIPYCTIECSTTCISSIMYYATMGREKSNTRTNERRKHLSQRLTKKRATTVDKNKKKRHGMMMMINNNKRLKNKWLVKRIRLCFRSFVVALFCWFKLGLSSTFFQTVQPEPFQV